MTPATKSTVIPTLRYRDAHAAIAFLCDVFGFERHAVYEAQDGSVAHAELVCGGGMIMLGSATNDSPFAQWVRPPAALNAVTTQAIYMIVADCEAHYARAKKAGAVILMDLENKNYGGAGYSCRDPEGNVWSFGTFDPWAPAMPGEKEA